MIEAPATRAMMARTAALFAGAGAFICLLGSFVPGEAQFDDDVLLARGGGVGAARRRSC